MKVFFVYIDRTTDGRPFYVGKGQQERVRMRRRNAHWRSIAAKHGWSREVVLATLDEMFAYEEEKRLVAELKTFEGAGNDCWGANRTPGGGEGVGFSGYKWSDECRARVSGSNNHTFGKRGPASHRYGQRHSAETKERNRLASTGEHNPNFGKQPAARVTWDIVNEIRRRWAINPFPQTTRNSDQLVAAGGCTAVSLAAEYDLTVASVYNIVRHKTWKLATHPHDERDSGEGAGAR